MAAVARGPLSWLPPGLRRPAVVLWLAAVVALPFKWLSPLEAAYERAILADALLAAAALARLLELPRRPLRLAAPHAWLAAYVAWVGISALFAPDRTTAAQALLIVVELAVLAVLTADLVGDDVVARAPGRVVLATVVFTAVARPSASRSSTPVRRRASSASTASSSSRPTAMRASRRGSPRHRSWRPGASSPPPSSGGAAHAWPAVGSSPRMSRS